MIKIKKILTIILGIAVGIATLLVLADFVRVFII